MIRIERMVGKDKDGAERDTNQRSVSIDGKRVGFIADDNPGCVLFHVHLRGNDIATVKAQLSELLGNDVQVKVLPPPPKRKRATSGDLF